MATVEQTRVLVSDPAGATQIFDDAHYQAIVDIEQNAYRAAASAARSLAAHFADLVSVTAGPVEIENQQRSERYLAIADGYDQRAREGGGSGSGSLSVGAPALTGISNDEIESVRDDEDRYQSAFYRGLDDNPSDDIFFQNGECS